MVPLLSFLNTCSTQPYGPKSDYIRLQVSLNRSGSSVFRKRLFVDFYSYLSTQVTTTDYADM